MALAGPAAAQQPAPQAFLEAIYKPYLAKDFKGQPYGEADRYFAPALAAAMERDMRDAKRRGEPPTLDGDPFVDAQEWQITDLAISVRMKSALTATATATFANFGKPNRLKIALVQTPAGWRIADIISPREVVDRALQGKMSLTKRQVAAGAIYCRRTPARFASFPRRERPDPKTRQATGARSCTCWRNGK